MRNNNFTNHYTLILKALFQWSVVHTFIMLLNTSFCRAESLTLPSEQITSSHNIEKPLLIFSEGEQRYLTIPNLSKFSIGSTIFRTLYQPKLKKDAILLKALTKGKTNLIVWKTDGSTETFPLEIAPWAPDSFSQSLSKHLHSLQNVEIILNGNNVILRGTIQNAEELKKILLISTLYPELVANQTQPSHELFNQELIRLKQWVTEQNSILNSKNIKVIPNFPYEHLIQINVASPHFEEKLNLEIKKKFPLARLIKTQAYQDEPVYFRIYLIELKRDRFHELGLEWPLPASGFLVLSSQAIKAPFQLDLTLKSLSGSGAAKILSQPELVVRAPGKAELFAGGELPIRNSSRFFSNVNWKNFGLNLTLNVIEKSLDQVKVDIMVEVSHLDESIQSDDVPGIQKNKITTEINAPFGRPMLLCGLLQETIREKAKGIPGLRNIPILGKLFGSEFYLREKSELVAILLPHHKTPTAPIDIFEKDFPKGTVPPPRNWISPQEIKKLKQSKNYPWNVFKS